jgi:hypothetical protein
VGGCTSALHRVCLPGGREGYLFFHPDTTCLPLWSWRLLSASGIVTNSLRDAESLSASGWSGDQECDSPGNVLGE